MTIHAYKKKRIQIDDFVWIIIITFLQFRPYKLENVGQNQGVWTTKVTFAISVLYRIQNLSVHCN